jgi:hypothetical protein
MPRVREPILEGTRIGKWWVLRDTDYTDPTHPTNLCQCMCGARENVLRVELSRRRSLQCRRCRNDSQVRPGSPRANVRTRKRLVASLAAVGRMTFAEAVAEFGADAVDRLIESGGATMQLRGGKPVIFSSSAATF